MVPVHVQWYYTYWYYTYFYWYELVPCLSHLAYYSSTAVLSPEMYALRRVPLLYNCTMVM